VTGGFGESPDRLRGAPDAQSGAGRHVAGDAIGAV